jgi:TetR/AcrR family transcriptional regulator, transcriptional repressor of bet genes
LRAGREATKGEREVPKLGMGPIRREQICMAAAAVIAREGFAGTTMRMVADEAGVSTGMLNHYFANRAELLTQTLVQVSERSQRRYERAIEGVPPGVERLEALLDSVLAGDEESIETWHVWINATGEALRLPALRHTIEERLGAWFELLDIALEGLVEDDDAPGAVPWTWRVDALLTGLAIQALTSEAELQWERIREEVVRMVLAGGGREPIALRRQLAR